MHNSKKLIERFNNDIQHNFKSALISLFNYEINHIVSNQTEDEIKGLIFRKNNNFTIPFVYKDGALFVDISFDLILENGNITNSINSEEYEDSLFFKYVSNLIIFFNPEFNNFISFLIKDCYFYKTFKDNINSKSALIEIILKKDVFFYQGFLTVNQLSVQF